ncbi:MAG: hypothetical protein ACN2B6_12675 [Rickettsiales bacterium]
MIFKLLLGLLTLLYPLAVYFGLQSFEARYVMPLLMLIMLLRIVTLNKSPLNHWLWLPAIGLLAIWSWLANSDAGLKLYPVVMNYGLMLVFFASLIHPPSLIEQLARIKEKNLPPFGVAYTRQVTKVWCGFFALNGSIALLTVFLSETWWLIYNGLVTYIAMGLLFAGEWLIRQQKLKQL